ncbi:flagellar biosynthetic protein FliO [Bosea sp. 124]|uniref:flagellar biosynthetic protein FliO n=1 Tax=Bosea sp. 124 TaxID=2135642 RepID=UPI000D486873|nr:flagellar biosynthetic protein FliO [Bosea sp. 124]PTM42364.1 flagellar biosynthesis protein FliO [Bosea sp. 124]
MQSLFGFDLPTAQKWVIAFGVILVLLVLLGLFARQIKDGRLRIKGQGGGRTRQPRLGVVDIHDLDRQRQLVLIRRDNVEHLVMIGGASDVVIETNIVRSGARAAVPAQPDAGMPDRPLPFDTLVPQEPLRQEPLRQEPLRYEPADDARRAPPPAPVALAPSGVEPVQPPPRTPPATPRPVQTLTQAEAAVAAATAVGGIAALGAVVASKAQATPVAPVPPVPPPHFTRDPAPAVSAGELDDMARQLDEALKRPFSAVRPANAPDLLPAEPIVAAPVPEPVLPPAEPPVEAAPAAILAPTVLPAFLGTGARVVPADVEAELEMALGLKPERTSPRPPLFAPPPSFVAPKPFEPMPPAEPVKSVEPEVIVPEPDDEPEPVFEPAPPAETMPEPEAEPEAEPQMGEDESKAIFDETQADEPEPADMPEEPAPESPAEEAVSQPQPEPEPKPIDPFSVDAIEAEFARLLGRDPKPRS